MPSLTSRPAGFWHSRRPVAQRVLAVRFHPRPAGRRHRCGRSCPGQMNVPATPCRWPHRRVKAAV